jgi:pantothenate synthetase
MSSRNERLSPEEREKAVVIIESLREAKLAFKKGERNASDLAQIVRKRMSTEPLATVDYVAIVDRDSLQPIEKIGDSEALIAIATDFAGVRLIDNVILNRKQ